MTIRSLFLFTNLKITTFFKEQRKISFFKQFISYFAFLYILVFLHFLYN